MKRRNLKDNILNNNLENLFNIYKEYLDFRAASLKGHKMDNYRYRKANIDKGKPSYIKYKM